MVNSNTETVDEVVEAVEEPQVEAPVEALVEVPVEPPVPSEAETAAIARAEAAEARVQEHEARAVQAEQANEEARIAQSFQQARDHYITQGMPEDVAHATVQGELNVWRARQAAEQTRGAEQRRFTAALEIGTKHGVAPSELMGFNSSAEMEKYAALQARINKLEKGQVPQVEEQQFESGRGTGAARTKDFGSLDRELTDAEHTELGKRLGY